VQTHLSATRRTHRSGILAEWTFLLTCRAHRSPTRHLQIQTVSGNSDALFQKRPSTCAFASTTLREIHRSAKLIFAAVGYGDSLRLTCLKCPRLRCQKSEDAHRGCIPIISKCARCFRICRQLWFTVAVTKCPQNNSLPIPNEIQILQILDDLFTGQKLEYLIHL
jgi:hypothetical protein